MPSTSSLTSSEKALIKKHAPVSSAHDKIHTAAIARVYYAYPDPAKWSYSGISGALVYGWGQNGGWLRVVDLAVSLAGLELRSDPVADVVTYLAGNEGSDLGAPSHGGYSVLPG